LSAASEAIDAGIISTLRASDRIYDASFLPSILVPSERTLPFLREAAARYQADILLIYRSVCRSFERYRLFEPNTVRSYCTVEAVLLDVRTGLVPFTASTTRVVRTEQSREDLNLREAILRSQLDAVAEAMDEVAEGVVDFLDAA
jgi:hypothetical protein